MPAILVSQLWCLTLLDSVQIAQAVLIPFLVEQKNMGAVGLDAVRQMIVMSPPPNRRVRQLSLPSPDITRLLQFAL